MRFLSPVVELRSGHGVIEVPNDRAAFVEACEAAIGGVPGHACVDDAHVITFGAQFCLQNRAIVGTGRQVIALGQARPEGKQLERFGICGGNAIDSDDKEGKNRENPQEMP